MAQTKHSTAIRSRSPILPTVLCAAFAGAVIGFFIGCYQTSLTGGFDDLLDGPRVEHLVIAAWMLILALPAGVFGAMAALALSRS